jgi:hypothetical protein
MDTVAIENAVAVRNALISAFRSVGMRLLPDADRQLTALFESKGVTATTNAAGYLELKQGNTLMVLSNAFETIRREHPEWFVSDPRRDAIASREDFHGSPQEIAHAKALWLSKHSLAEWEALPRTRAEAEIRSVAPSADMNRKEYLSLPVSERAQLAGLIGVDGISRIMSRTK